jgi:hypothetical protein
MGLSSEDVLQAAWSERPTVDLLEWAAAQQFSGY